MTAAATHLARKLVPLDQAANSLHCSKHTVRRFIARGELRAYYIGTGRSLLRIDLDDLEALMRLVNPNNHEGGLR